MSTVARKPSGSEGLVETGKRLRPAAQPAAARASVRPFATERVLETTHARLSVRETRGDGFPVVLLHGNSTCKEVFRHQMSGPLASRFRMIAIDLPGHGASGDAYAPDRTYTFSGYADAVAEALEIMGINRMAIVGWSLGGHVGIDLMASLPGLAGLMIVGTPPIGTTLEAIQAGFRPNPELLATVGQVELSEAQRTSFAALIGFDPDDLEFHAALRRCDGRARASVFADLLSGQASDQRVTVETVPVPLAVVNGAEDAIVEPRYLSHLAYANLWNGQCFLLPRIGHAPFLEAPEIFNEILLRFAAEMEQRTDIGLPWNSLCLSG